LKWPTYFSHSNSKEIQDPLGISDFRSVWRGGAFWHSGADWAAAEANKGPEVSIIGNSYRHPSVRVGYNALKNIAARLSAVQLENANPRSWNCGAASL
jgi:hypothetical protein